MARLRLRGSTAAAFICALALLAGCQHYVDKPVKSEQTADALLHRSLADPGLHAFLEKNLGHDLPDWPVKTWDFDTLNWVALYYNPSLDVARTQWGVVRGSIVTAAESPNPNISISPGYDFNPGNAISPWFPGISFNWPIETAGKREKRIQFSELQAEAARQTVFATAWQVRTQLRQALIQYGVAARRAQTLRDLAGTQHRVLDLLVQRLNAGAVATDEISATRVAVVKAEADAGNADQQLAVAKTQLAQVLGVPVSALEDQNFSDSSIVTPRAYTAEELSTARALCLHSRPDILSALVSYDASQAKLRLELARQYPDLQLGSGYLYDLGENKWNITFGIELPIMNDNEGLIAEAQASRRAAAAQLIAVQAHVIADIDAAEAANAAATATLENLLRVQSELEKHFKLVGQQHDAGEADQLDYQTAQLDLDAGTLAVVDAQAQAALATAQLEDTFQVPFTNLAAVQNDAHPLTPSPNSP